MRHKRWNWWVVYGDGAVVARVVGTRIRTWALRAAERVEPSCDRLLHWDEIPARDRVGAEAARLIEPNEDDMWELCRPEPIRHRKYRTGRAS